MVNEIGNHSLKIQKLLKWKNNMDLWRTSYHHCLCKDKNLVFNKKKIHSKIMNLNITNWIH